MCCLNWWAASATISWKASSIWLIIPVWNSCQGCSMLKRVWVELLTKMRRALKDQAKSEWMILGVKHFHSARNLWLYCKDPPKGNITDISYHWQNLVYHVFYLLLFFSITVKYGIQVTFYCIEIQVKIMRFISFSFFCHCENPKNTFLCQNPPHVVTKTIFSSAFWSFIHFTI